MMITHIESNANTPAHEIPTMRASTTRQHDEHPRTRHNFAGLSERRVKEARQISRQTKCGNSTFQDRVQEAFDQVDRGYRVAMKTISGEKARREKSYREAEYISAASAFYLAVILQDDDDLWETFRKEAIWKGRAVDRKNVLRLALIYMYRAVTKSELDRARDHTRALQSLWEDGTYATEVAERLHLEGGFDAFKKHPKKLKGAVTGDVKRGVFSLTLELPERLLHMLEGAPVGKTFYLAVRRERKDERTRFVARRAKPNT